MDPFASFYFFVALIITNIILIIVAFWFLTYTETDKFGRKYHRNLFYPGRFCLGYGSRVLTKIPSCLFCGRDFSTDKSGLTYRRPLFYPGRICPGCGLRVLTKIPSCLSCGRDFSKDSEGTNVQHRDNF